AWVGVLASGVTPAAVAYGFAAGPEREGQRVAQDYRQYLGRSPSATEIAGWVTLFENGSATNEGVVTGFLSAPEYFLVHFSNATDWFASAFQNIFGQPSNTLTSTIPTYLPAMASAFTHSVEYYTGIITTAYQHYLSRSPNSTELGTWLQAM